MWAIWKNRNSQLWENKKQRPSETAMLSLGWLQEFKTANAPVYTPSNAPSNGRQQRWIVPEAGWIKCNCDGAFLASTHRGGSGIILRNEHGIFQAAANKAYVQVTSPFHSELNALLDGLRLAETLDLDRVLFETDCLMLIQALQQQDLDLSNMGSIIAEMKDLLSKHAEFRIAHVYRVAHVLANQALHSSESQTWFVVAPSSIRDAILSDCNH